jgi:hypothetical protein
MARANCEEFDASADGCMKPFSNELWRNGEVNMETGGMPERRPARIQAAIARRPLACDPAQIARIATTIPMTQWFTARV